jgi:NADH dehydrogenase
MSTEPHVVIVGGGFGGLTAAKALRKAKVRVTLVDRENHHLFQPLLYQVATASLSPGQIAVPIRGVLGRQKNTHVVLDEAREVDLAAKTLKLRGGDVLSWDYLIAATGAKTNYFGHDEWAKYAGGLKSLRDALRIREKVLLAFEEAEDERDEKRRRGLLTFVVIGGGPTGVEMAGAISELARHVLSDDFKRITPSSIRVVLVEMADRVLTPFSPDLSEKAKKQLEELCVEVKTKVGVTEIDALGVTLADGERIEAAAVVWATGVKPTSFAQLLGVPLHKSGRVLVDASCAVEGHKNVFAVGDMAFFLPAGATMPLPGVAQVAIQQANHVVKSIKRDLEGKPRETFAYFDKGSMATIGRSRAVLEAGKLKMSGFLAWLAWGLVHVLYLIGFHNRVLVMLTWIWSYVTYRRGARLITTHIARRKLPLSELDETADPARPAVVEEPPALRASIPDA